MNKEKFGELLKEVRLSRGFTRNDLADGLCSSTYLYNIERGEYYPSPFILDGFSKKLEFDLYELMQDTVYSDAKIIKQIKEKLNFYYTTGDFIKMKSYLEKCYERYKLDEPSDRKLFEWYRGITVSIVDKNQIMARTIFEDSMKGTIESITFDEIYLKFFTSLDLKIIKSFAVTFSNEEERNVKMTLYKAILPTYNIYYTDKHEYYEFLYSFAYLNVEFKNYLKAKNLISFLEKRLFRTGDLHLIADIIYLKGKVLYHLNSLKESKEAFMFFFSLKEIAIDNKKRIDMYKSTVQKKYGFDL
jgi:transcriptional regulator with XRE-family HTH domain